MTKRARRCPDSGAQAPAEHRLERDGLGWRASCERCGHVVETAVTDGGTVVYAEHTPGGVVLSSPWATA